MLLGGLTFGETEAGSPGSWAVGQRSQEPDFLDPYLCLVSCVPHVLDCSLPFLPQYCSLPSPTPTPAPGE